jgi:glutaredoxin
MTEGKTFFQMSLSTVRSQRILGLVEILRRQFFLFLCALLLVVVGGCKKREAIREVAPPTITDASTDLLFTWIDEKGEFHVEQKVADVPVTARDVVRVADPVKDPAKLDDIWVADLRTAGANGQYPVKAVGRPEFEKIALDRRAANGKGSPGLAAQSAAPVLPGDQKPNVIIYGASWCGPCHQAAAFFKQRGVPFVEKDIEADSGAAREMHAKLDKAGMRGGSIPVIDVRGKLFVGFDANAVERALGTAL